MVDSDLLFEKKITIYSELDTFVFSKKDGEIIKNVSLSKDGMRSIKVLPQFIPKIGSGLRVHSIVGIINGKLNNYLLAVDRATFVGSVLNSRIFKIESLVYLSSLSNERGSIIPEADKPYLTMIDSFLERNNLFFSDSLDLTLSMNKLFTTKNSNSSFIFPNTNTNFCWNHKISREFDSNDFLGFIHPIINGYVSIRKVSDYSHEFDYAIIARKDNRRSGMRFLVRGNDRNGFSANFVESETILWSKSKKLGKINVMSYLQIRGSIPLLWTQLPNLQLNPRIVPRSDHQENYESFKRHLSDVNNHYGKSVMVNLIDRKGSQKEIGEYFANLSKELKDSKTGGLKDFDYVWFDFHHECKGMKYQNLSKLLKMTSVSGALRDFDLFHAEIESLSDYSKNVNIISLQKGVFRTNCVDCLDRTNVVQTVFARGVLHTMLFRLNLSEGPSGEPFQEFNPVFENLFKIIWADHGDFLSHAYSGTNALKSDFVRTGKRTKKGAIQDGYHTCQRFYINNFCDGYNQDCHDYFLGEINPRKENFKEHSTTNVKLLTPSSLLLVFTIYYFLVGLSLPADYEDNLKKKAFRAMIFIGVFFLTFKTIFTTMKKTLIDTATVDKS